MRKLVTLAILLAVLAIAGAARTAVNRHYDYLQVEQENTRLERRLAALRANASEEEDGSALPLLMGAVTLLLAASALVGQGGLVVLLANANKVIRSLRRSRSRPLSARPAPDRYLMHRPPAADEEIRWN